MNIIVYVNPKSGRGKAQSICDRFLEKLNERGHRVVLINAIEQSHKENALVLQTELAQADRVVIIGGDGTVHHLLPFLSQSNTPLYHIGTGTANLIAREFKMSTKVDQVLHDVELDIEPVLLDLPTCNGVPFMLMTSIGIDGSIIHRLEESKRTKRGYRAYFTPTISEIISPRLAHIRYRTTETDQWESVKGGFIVSNLKSYGGGFNPSPNADPTDGLLDIYVAQTNSIIQAIVQYGFLRIKAQLKSMHRFRCKEIVIEHIADESEGFVQIDGEQAQSVPSLEDGVLCNGSILQFSMSENQVSVHAGRPDERQ